MEEWRFEKNEELKRYDYGDETIWIDRTIILIVSKPIRQITRNRYFYYILLTQEVNGSCDSTD